VPQKKWLYTLVIVSCLAGSLWVAWNVTHYTPIDAASGTDVCLFRRVTGIPCPSCGSTRSILHISRLEFREALYANPIGFLLAVCIILFPLWILYDLAKKKNSFYHFYGSMEMVIRKRWVAALLIFLVAANWMWNIYKFA
jgi:hypothetical protein